MTSSPEGNENAGRVFIYIRENPGCYLRQIKKELHLSIGSMQYHLNKLENDGKIVAQRRGIHKNYFPIGIFKDNEKEIMTFLVQEISREIMMFIIEKGNPTQTDIANQIKLSSPSIYWHLKKLLNSNIIQEIKDGKYKRYVLNPEISSAHIGKLLKNYYPSIWNKWSNRIAEMFLLLSSIEETKEDDV